VSRYSRREAACTSARLRPPRRTEAEPRSNNVGHCVHCVRSAFGIAPGFGLRCASAQGMVSTLQHDAASATEAACATALRASWPHLTAPLLALLSRTDATLARRRRPGHVEHEKKTFFSLLQNSRSRAVSQGRARARAPARAIFARVGWLSAFIGAQRRAFTDGAAEATARERVCEADCASLLCFEQVPAAATASYSRSNREPRIFTLAARFQHVPAAVTSSYSTAPDWGRRVPVIPMPKAAQFAETRHRCRTKTHGCAYSPLERCGKEEVVTSCRSSTVGRHVSSECFQLGGC
jgi:hypothetical protein